MLPNTLRSGLTRLWSALSTWNNPPSGPDTPADNPEEIPMAAARTPTAPTAPQDQTAKDDSLFWDQYVKEADLYDRELVKGLGGDLDTLLIFAGLFSAVNTAIIIEAYKDLRPDPTESGGTNALLRTLIHTLDNSTAPILPTTFVPPPRAVAVNALFFASLCCSLFAAFGAVLAKQWLNEYERTGDHRVPHARARQRHAKFLGLQKYRCEMVMQALGSILQISLFLFFLALANWLWGIHRAIAAVAIAGFTITFIFFFATTIISVYDAASPFATRFSTILRELRQSIKSVDTITTTTATGVVGILSGMAGVASLGVLDGRVYRDGWLSMIAGDGLDQMVDDDAIIEMDGKCVAWVRDNATMFESVAGMARAAAFLPHRIRHIEGLYHTRVGPVLLRSIISSNAIPLGFADGTLFSTVNTIRDAMTSWKGVPIDLACDVLAQLHQMLRLTVPKDPVLSELLALTLEHVDIDVPSTFVLRSRRPEQQTLIDLVQMPTLTLEGKRAGLSLLWKYYFRERYWDWTWRINEIRNAADGPLEESWPWRVADVLAATAKSGAGYDRDARRLEFRVCWAVAFGPTANGLKKMVFGDDSEVSPIWRRFSGSDAFKEYFTWRFLPSLHQHGYFGMAAANFITSSISQKFYKKPDSGHGISLDFLRGAGGISMDCRDLIALNLDVLETAFQIPQFFFFSATRIAPLYVWFHLRQYHTKVSLPIACVNVKYLAHVVGAFLLQQLSESTGPWLPAQHLKVTVDAVQAYIAQLPPDHPRIDRFGSYELTESFDLLQKIRGGSHRYKGPARDGQQLWDCLVLVLGVVLASPERDEGGQEKDWYTVDWAKVEAEALTILGSEDESKPTSELQSKPKSDPSLPESTSLNFRAFDSY